MLDFLNSMFENKGL
jgi:hypothetical protein